MRFDSLTMVLSFIILASAFAGCASTTMVAHSTKVNYGDGVKVSGVITHRDRMAMPANAIVIVRLVDVSTPGSPTTLSEQTITAPGQTPVPFVLVLASDNVDENHNYAIEAVISVGGKPMWKNTQQYGVITRGNPTNNLMVWVQPVD